MWSARGRGHGGVVLSRSRPRPRAPLSRDTHINIPCFDIGSLFSSSIPRLFSGGARKACATAGAFEEPIRCSVECADVHQLNA